MKKITLTLLLVLTINTNAQVTEIYVPNTYDVGGYAGATLPFYQKDGFIYCISHKTISNAEGKIFKINQMTNAVTEIQENNPFYFNSGNSDLPFYNGEYNDKVFFSVWQSYANLLNTSNNTFTTQYFQYGELNKVFQNYLVEGTNKKNIDTDVVSNIGNVNAEYNNQPTSLNVVETSAISNSSFYATHKEYLPFIGSLGTNKIFKFTNSSSLNYSLEYIAPNNHYIQGVHNGTNTYDLFQIGNKLIFSETIYPCCPYNSVLKSMDVNNNQVSTLLTATDNPSYIKSFIFNNELYFYLNSDTGTDYIKKTNGINVINTNLYGVYSYVLQTSWYLPHINFIEYQGNMYSIKQTGSSDNAYLIKYDGNNEYNISSEINGIYKAMIHNNIMYFYGLRYISGTPNYGLFSFDGNTIRQLNLGTTPVVLALGSSLYGYNNFLFFGNGQSLVKIDLNTVSSTVIASNLSSQSFEKTNITFSPNPTQSQITFEQEVSGLEIFDVSGKKVKSFTNNNTTFDVSDLQKGIYFLKGKTVEGNEFNEKLIKE